MQIKFRWLGNAGFEFDLGNSILLVDPYLTRPRQSRVYSGRTAPDSTAIKAHIYRCDNILVTHTHFDHFMDVPDIALQTGAAVHGSYNTCELAQKLGVSEKQTHLIKAGDEFTIDNIHVKVIPAAHPWIPGYTSGRLTMDLQTPLRLRDYRMDSCLSFLITYQSKRLLIWSSTRTDKAETAEMLICRAVSGKRWYAQMMKRSSRTWLSQAIGMICSTRFQNRRGRFFHLRAWHCRHCRGLTCASLRERLKRQSRV